MLGKKMKKLNLPKVSERIRGITLPENGIVFVCDYDEVFKINIEGEPSVEILDDDPYEFLDSLEHSLGVNECKSILSLNGNTISYLFNPLEDFVTVKYSIQGIFGQIDFRALSGDWIEASLSKCNKYLVLAEPYSFEIYKLS